jgi:GAF domain-containing protein
MNERLALLRNTMAEIDLITSETGSSSEILQRVCDTLASIPGYDWSGYYLVDGTRRDTLLLGPFHGEPTEHRNIAFGQGICGQAAESQQTFLVNDVSTQGNYLSCSPKVKSEIVVPVFSGCRLVGELDLDSHTRNCFTSDDRRFLEWVAEATSGFVTRLAKGE